MANSYVEHTNSGTGTNGLGQKIFTVPTNFININDIVAKGYNGSSWTELTIASRGTTTVELSAIPTGYTTLRLFRRSTTEPIVDFQNGATLSESDLDTAYRQGLYVAQEVAEDADPDGGSGIGNISNAQLAGGITNDKLAGSITNDKLAGSITDDKLASGVGTSANNLVKLDGNSALPVADKIVHSGDTNTAIRFPANDTISFETDDSEAMRIDNEGNLLVGGTSDTGFQIVSTALGQNGCLDCVSSSTNGYYALRIDMHANNNYAQLFRQGGSVVGSILTQNGSTSYNTSSDYRLKENVTYDFDATSRLKQLKPCRFNFTGYTDTTVDGFLAHEVQTIVPEAVSGEKDAVDADGNIDPQGVDLSKLVPLLVKTIQELETRIATLEAQ